MRKGKEKGQSLVEVALVIPVMLVILAGVLDLGRLYYVTVALTDAAAEGATYAAIHPSDADGVVNRTQAASSELVQIDPGKVTYDCPATAAGATVTVTVGYDFTVATPAINAIVPDGVLRLRGVAAETILSGGM